MARSKESELNKIIFHHESFMHLTVGLYCQVLELDLKGRDRFDDKKNKVFDYSMFSYRIDTQSLSLIY